jgi:four helix bundle protein
MDKLQLERRTKEFALSAVAFVASLPKNKVADVLGYQLLKSETSVGSNYREANRAESRNDFIHKIGIAEKEASESQYWLELLQGAHVGEPEERNKLLREFNELIAIFTAIGKTAKARRPVHPIKVRNAESKILNPKL